MNRQRFEDANFRTFEVTVVGAGGIGSHLAPMLKQIGHHVVVYDGDNVESQNIATQNYGPRHIGMNKNEAIKDVIFANTGESIEIDDWYDGMATPVMFACVDNMKARKEIFKTWKTQDNPKLLIDGRLQAEMLQVFAVTPDRVDKYEQTLFADSDVEEGACTYRQTYHFGTMIASIMTALFTNWDKIDQGEGRLCPFYTEFVGMLFHYENQEEYVCN